MRDRQTERERQSKRNYTQGGVGEKKKLYSIRNNQKLKKQNYKRNAQA